MCPPFLWPGSFPSRLRFSFRLWFHLARLLFHPLVQLRFLEAPAITQLERGNLLLAYILVKRVRTHAQILRRLPNVHHFSRVGHRSFCLFVHFHSPAPTPVAAGLCFGLLPPSHCLCGGFGVPSISQPCKTSAGSESPRFLGFWGCFLELQGQA